jgi:hypothetical protein
MSPNTPLGNASGTVMTVLSGMPLLPGAGGGSGANLGQNPGQSGAGSQGGFNGGSGAPPGNPPPAGGPVDVTPNVPEVLAGDVATLKQESAAAKVLNLIREFGAFMK